MSLCDFVVKNRGKGVYYYKGGILQRLRWVATALAVSIAVGPALAEQAELTRLVDSPTAGLIEKGRYAMNMRLFANGGVAGCLQAGGLQRLSIGLSSCCYLNRYNIASIAITICRVLIIRSRTKC